MGFHDGCGTNQSDETYRDGQFMSVLSRNGSPAAVARHASDTASLQKVRCLCGKWWAYRQDDKLILLCKLCRREIVISGDNLTISYR